MRELSAAVDAAGTSSGTTTTVGEYLDEWLEVVQPQLRPTSWNSYRRAVAHIKGPCRWRAARACTRRSCPSACHATISVTLDLYSHVTPAIDAEAAALVASKILGSPNAAEAER